MILERKKKIDIKCKLLFLKHTILKFHFKGLQIQIIFQLLMPEKHKTF